MDKRKKISLIYLMLFFIILPFIFSVDISYNTNFGHRHRQVTWNEYEIVKKTDFYSIKDAQANLKLFNSPILSFENTDLVKFIIAFKWGSIFLGFLILGILIIMPIFNKNLELHNTVLKEEKENRLNLSAMNNNKEKLKKKHNGFIKKVFRIIVKFVVVIFLVVLFIYSCINSMDSPYLLLVGIVIFILIWKCISIKHEKDLETKRLKVLLDKKEYIDSKINSYKQREIEKENKELEELKSLGIAPDDADRWNYIKIRLNTGRKIEVESLYFGYTYSDYFEGRITESLNMHIFNKINYPTEKWGERRVLKIEPNDFKKELLPIFYSVKLMSYKPINPSFDWSELVVIWFDDLPANRSMEAILQKGLENIDWDNYAEDCSY